MTGLQVDVAGSLGTFAYDLHFQADRPVTALLGPSGAGKSVTLRAIAGLLRPTHGRIVLDGRVLFDAAARVDLPTRDRNIGLVVQNNALFPHLDVAANIGFGLHRWSRADRDRRVAGLAELIELQDRLSARPSELSGGQAQRVALARALAPRPSLLLLDEPFASLDEALKQRLRDAVGRMLAQEQVRALLVTHDSRDAEALGAESIGVAAGRIG